MRGRGGICRSWRCGSSRTTSTRTCTHSIIGTGTGRRGPSVEKGEKSLHEHETPIVGLGGRQSHILIRHQRQEIGRLGNIIGPEGRGVGLGRAARIRGRVLMGREGRDGAAATGVRELSPDHFES